MKTIGVYAGSFDPITNGHVNVIKQSCALFDEVYVAVGINPSKKYFMGDQVVRTDLVDAVLRDELSAKDYLKIHAVSIKAQFLINFATEVSATHLIRGIRNPLDFTAESAIQDINREINPDIETVFFIPPDKYKSLSSSVVKGFVGFEGWEELVAKKVNPIIVQALRDISNRT